MPHDEKRSGLPGDWLRRAMSNLVRAEQAKPEEVLWEDLCFDAQQAAEKALKAMLSHLDVPFRFVHDIGELLTAVDNSGKEIPPEVFEAAELTGYAVEARYPGLYEPVTPIEHERAVKLARLVVEWVKGELDH